TLVVVGRHVIKESDLERDMRVVSFLNQASLDTSADARKKSASRLIDQELIREQIRLGNYSAVPEQDVDQLLKQDKQDRFANDAAYRAALTRYGISEDDLREALLWQSTALHFISERFRPAVVDADKLKPQEVEQQINQLLEDWLRTARIDAK